MEQQLHHNQAIIVRKKSPNNAQDKKLDFNVQIKYKNPTENQVNIRSPQSSDNVKHVINSHEDVTQLISPSIRDSHQDPLGRRLRTPIYP